MEQSETEGQLQLSREIIIVAAALGAVVFLFLMDYYYRSLEATGEEHPLEPDEHSLEPDESAVEVGEQTDETNIAA